MLGRSLEPMVHRPPFSAQCVRWSSLPFRLPGVGARFHRALRLLYCPVLRSIASDVFRKSIEFDLSAFLLCRNEREDLLCFRALLIYGAYRAHNRYRALDAIASPARAADCVTYFMRRAAARHHVSLRVLAGPPQQVRSVASASSGRAIRANPTDRPQTNFVHGGELGPWPMI